MNNKGFKILLIFFLSFIALSLIGILIGAIVYGYDLSFDNSNYELVKKEEFDISDIKNFTFDGISADVEFYESDNEKIIIEQYADSSISSRDLFTTHTKGNKLTINDGKQRKIFFSFNFGFRGWYYKIYIPSSYQNDLEIKTVSGNISFHLALASLDNVKLNTTSGDVAIANKISTNSLFIKTVSGDLKLSEISSNRLELNTTSGDIKLDKVAGDLQINTVSGEIEIKNIIGKIDLKTTSGDIELDGFMITNDSNIKTVSGNVNILFTTDSDYEIQTRTTSGDVKLPNGSSVSGNVPYNKLEIKTTSGNIEIKNT